MPEPARIPIEPAVCGLPGDAATEAALQSEIADAQRAIAKVELLATHWWRVERQDAAAS